jgi:hypothetical protein
MKKFLEIFRSKKTFRAVCIGDSTTTQDWCHPNWISWLNFTFRETEDWDIDWRRKVINCGRDGANISHYLKFFDEEVTLFKPHVVITSIGLNNLIPHFDQKEMEHSLRLLFKNIRSIKSDLITWSPYAIPKEKYLTNLKRINNLYKKLTKEFNGVYIDTYSEFLKYDIQKLFTFKSDGNSEWEIKKGDYDFLHCNVAGNQIIAEKIAKEAFGEKLNDWEFGTMKLLDLNKFKKKK